MGQNLKVVQRGFARRQKHELAALVKLLSKESVEAIDKLHGLLKSEDEKIRLGAIKLTLETMRDFTADINTDDLQRLIANVKYNGPGELEEDDTPQINFTDIIDA